MRFCPAKKLSCEQIVQQTEAAVPWLLAMGRNDESFSGGEDGWACPFFLSSVRIVECRAAGEGGQNPTGAMEVARENDNVTRGNPRSDREETMATFRTLA